MMHAHLDPTESSAPNDSPTLPDNTKQPGPLPAADLLNTTAVTTAIETKLPPFKGD